MRADDIVRYETLTLEKAKVAAMQAIGPQMAYSMKADVAADFITRNLVVRLQSEVLSHKDGTDEQEVYSEVEVLPHKRHLLFLCLPLAGLGVALFVLAAHTLAAIVFAVAFALSVAYVLSRPQRARKLFRVKAERWVRFPENTRVYPRELGSPVVQIIVDAWPDDVEPG